MIVAPARAVARPRSPYVGLVPFGEDDAAFFCGRSHETAVVSANLRAARLTILYGPSGVGKSSLLHAGVIHSLREEAASAAGSEAPFAVGAVRSWIGDPVRTVREAARDALQALSAEPLPPPRETLVESLHAWTERTRTLLLVLDQFEEFFQYQRVAQGDELVGFAAELADVVNDPRLPVNVLLSIREDAWAKLDRFEGHIPLLFANYLRVDHLDVDAAREAIEGPIAAWNATLPRGEEPCDVKPEVIKAVLDAARGGLTGDSAAAPAADDRIEAPFLQLVLERLWRATVNDGGRDLTIERLDALGGPRKIVENHLREALAGLSAPEQDVASECFRFLVSTSRTKIAHTASDLAEWTRRTEPETATVLENLCSGEHGRILRAVAPAADEAQTLRYELFHDVLAEPILTWRRAHEQERARRAFRRRVARIAAVALTLVSGFAALAAWAWLEKGHAQTARARAVKASIIARNAEVHAKAAEVVAKHQRKVAVTQRKVAVTQRKVAVAQRNKADRLLRNQLRIDKGLKHTAATLQHEQSKTKKRRQENAAHATALQTRVDQLRAENHALATQVGELRQLRDGLDRDIASLRERNRRLAAGIKRFNRANSTLTATNAALESSNLGLSSTFATLKFLHGALTENAATLKAQAAGLSAQLDALERQHADLSSKARQLGLQRVEAVGRRRPKQSEAEVLPSAPARVFGIPAEIRRTDDLRRRVEALRRQLALLRQQHARLKNEEAFLQKQQTLLQAERDALRDEITRLTATRAALGDRSRKLRKSLRAARAENSGLRGANRELTAVNRSRRRAVADQRTANGRLQATNNKAVEKIAGLQKEIDSTRADNAYLIAFIAPLVGKIAQGAEDPNRDAALAGLLAVKAYRLTPYDADDPAHPDVYNALWLALSRLDAKAAFDLIAPVAKPGGKIGTTQSATIAAAICGVAARPLTRDEWGRFLPPRAPYTDASSRPCG